MFVGHFLLYAYSVLHSLLVAISWDSAGFYIKSDQIVVKENGQFFVNPLALSRQQAFCVNITVTFAVVCFFLFYFLDDPFLRLGSS